MNITNSNILALATVLVAGASSAFAAGQLGERFIGIGYTQVDFDGDFLEDGKGGTLHINMPLTKTVDLSASYSFMSSETPTGLSAGSTYDVDAKEAFFSASFYFVGSKAKPYLRPGIGWAKAEAQGSGIRVDEDEAVYDVEAGVEVPVGDRVAITPFVGWSDAFDSDYEGTFRYGVMADIDVTKSLGVVLGVTGDDDDDITYGIGALIRF
jgi:opacity protein-like surface antigen